MSFVRQASLRYLQTNKYSSTKKKKKDILELLLISEFIAQKHARQLSLHLNFLLDPEMNFTVRV